MAQHPDRPSSSSASSLSDLPPHVARALAAARETRQLEIGHGALKRVPEVFAAQFGPKARAAVVADRNTWRVAGQAVSEGLRAAKRGGAEPFVFDEPDLYAEHRFVERLQHWLATHDAIPVAVGSGSINDLVKLAAHRSGRQYLCVATAASMDGYTAFGSSITYQGSKQTFDCPAPQAVVADLDVICAAPPLMNAAGYADLLAKVTAGADWIVADELGVEPIDQGVWDLIQPSLREALSDPAGVRAGDSVAIRRLVEGLMMGGFAMQASKTSRPASGAEHQFSHLWDMQHHTHNGAAPAHGFKVGVATLAMTRLYEYLFSLEPKELAQRAASQPWPQWPDQEAQIRELFPEAELRDKALLESKAKYVAPAEVDAQRELVVSRWPKLRERLMAQLVPQVELSEMLRAAGAPDKSEQIGIFFARLRDSHRLACHIRRRYTVLDLAVRMNVLDEALRALYPAA